MARSSACSFVSGGSSLPRSAASPDAPARAGAGRRLDAGFLEGHALPEGYAGVDEVGRGPLAGPVVAAAVILNPADIPEFLADSKTLKKDSHGPLAEEIKRRARAFALATVWNQTIDRVNILQATFLAMARAVSRLSTPPTFLAIDGNHLLPPHVLTDVLGVDPHGFAQRAVVGGDGSVAAISAASIIAKAHRDRIMVLLDAKYPGYGFASNKGYGSAQVHQEALTSLGPCRIHRRSFRGVLPDTTHASKAPNDARAKETSAWLPGI